jgi:hypothetical protein
VRAILAALFFAASLGYRPAMASEDAASSQAAPTVALASTAPAGRIDKAKLDRQVEALLKECGKGVEASLWLGDGGAIALYELTSSKARPTASSIKAFYLVELFTRHADNLDKPLPGTDEILKNDRHPAMSMFKDPAARDEIRRVLTGASVRRVGEVMTRGTAGAEPMYGNAVYNAAANLVTVALGGPEPLTQLIRKRDPAFNKVSVRRYMLADRTAGDNEAPAAAFAVLYRKLVSQSLHDLDAKTLQAIRTVLTQEMDAKLGLHLTKGGDLGSDPQTCVREGCWFGKQTINYVVMLVRTDRVIEDRDASYKRLQDTAEALRTVLTEAGLSAK